MASLIGSLSLWHNLMPQKTFMPFNNSLPLSPSLSITCRVFETPKEEKRAFALSSSQKT